VKFAIELGISPVMLFFDKSRRLKNLHSPIEVGILPDKLKVLKVNCEM
jgi:hypothetical protein